MSDLSVVTYVEFICDVVLQLVRQTFTCIIRSRSILWHMLFGSGCAIHQPGYIAAAFSHSGHLLCYSISQSLASFSQYSMALLLCSVACRYMLLMLNRSVLVFVMGAMYASNRFSDVDARQQD